ncbi:MAG: glycosyltransferase family 4 protein [Nitrososphaerota archaeon]
MKIAYILPSLAQRGPIIVVKELIDNIIKNHYVRDIMVFYFDDIVQLKFQCKTKRINIDDKINFDYFDIIHSHMLRPDFYLFKNKILGNIKTAKIISTLHQYNYMNLRYDLKNRISAYFFAKLWNLLLTQHDCIVCLSKDMVKNYEKQAFINSGKLRYIYNGITPKNLYEYETNYEDKEANYFTKESIILGTSCLLTKRKGLEQVIKIMPDIPNMYFVILGSGEEENNLKSLARSLKVLQRCIFLGFKQDPFKYYKYFDIFILPSRSEGFPLALLEAASMKKPIICSNLNIFREIFPNGEVVFFDLDNLKDLRDKIIYTYKNREYYAEKVYISFLKQYTSEIMAKRYFELYKEIRKT